jgi:hypothetical protein
VNGLRVGGMTDFDGITESPAFEVMHGSLILIDVRIEKMII